MSPQKTKSGPVTEFFTASDLKQQKKQEAMRQAKKFKEDSIKAANENMGLCGIIAIALILTAIAFPAVGVIVLFA